MPHVSTRGRSPQKSFSEILLEGLAPDGGLYTLMPGQYPKVDLDLLRNLPYLGIAMAICQLFAPEIDFVDWGEMLQKVYTEETFGTPEITPVRWLEPGFGLLELSNGPTGAFKDLSLQVLAPLMDSVLARQGQRTNVIVATSGDTGGAAVEAFRGRACADLFALYPHGRVSDMQRRMMTTAAEPNIHAVAVEGDFDDCQAIVKALFNDSAFREQVRLSGVNSINWARIVAQVIYWFAGYFYATTRNSERLTVVIPSGNFGDAFAAYLAKRMGLPINIIIATNENNILYRFFLTDGIYQLADKVVPTTSPSMDIQVSSNFERLIFDIADGDAQVVRKLMKSLAEERRFDAWSLLPGERSGIRAGMATMAEVKKTICLVQKYDCLIDPHTAVGVGVGLEYRKTNEPMIIARTAQAWKFDTAVYEATGVHPPVPARWQEAEKLPERIHHVGAGPQETMNYILQCVQ